MVRLGLLNIISLNGMLDFNTLVIRKTFFMVIPEAILNPLLLKEVDLYVPKKYTRGRFNVLSYAP